MNTIVCFNIFILCFQNLLWVFAKSVVSEWSPVKKNVLHFCELLKAEKHMATGN